MLLFNNRLTVSPRLFYITLISLLLSACNQEPATTSTTEQVTAPEVDDTAAPVVDRLAQVLDAMSEQQKQRYEYRHPYQTLKFIGIEPGMQVGEVLPGNNGWYTTILLPYLGSEGKLVGIDYAMTLWPNFSWMNEKRIQKKVTWVTDWTAATQQLAGDDGPQIMAYQSQAMPDELRGTLDAVLYFRAMHNLAVFNDQGGFLDTSLKEAYDSLKPGGVLAVVQHRAREDRPDEWANGSNGYLKQSYVIEQVQAAGFALVAASNINANPLDQAKEGDQVWRLPPTNSVYAEGSEQAAAAQKIGESHRMTLKFRKPK